MAPVEITRIVRRQIRILGSYGGRARNDIPELLKLIQVPHIPTHRQIDANTL
jgi:D-arabinose 1-dehydrogenase-like Zn-dependent alcohol dehydrogenase